MKELLFHSVAANPRIAPILEGQVRNTLRPFERFLKQAIHTAKQRQFRYALPWEKPPEPPAILQLDALNCRVRLPIDKPSTCINSWPDSLQPDKAQPSFDITNSRLIEIEHAEIQGSRLILRTSPVLKQGTQLAWCGQTWTIDVTGQPQPPSSVQRLDGREIPLQQPATRVEDDFWELLLGTAEVHKELLVDGCRTQVIALPATQDLSSVIDAADQRFPTVSAQLKCNELPADGPLMGNNGIQFRWSEPRANKQKGVWVQLLPPEADQGEEFLDPRAVFCEDGVEEVWTQKQHRKEHVYKVRRVDRDRYQLLLDRLPPPGTTLYLPVNLGNLQLQQRALQQLRNSPLPHHQGLLRLCENPEKVRWPAAPENWPKRWYELTDETRSGTDEQRRFVAKALGSPDLALLEGPPGSGKTTAICEIIQQLVAEGQKVLLCASTHVAIDNVLDRLTGPDTPIDAVRIGKADRVDENVQKYQIDSRIEALLDAWRDSSTLQGFSESRIREMAERTVITSASLTCGTTMGIVAHPFFRDEGSGERPWERPISRLPHWDVLIIDEASKTLIQEFLVPALMARRCIVVGDVHQLPPFADRADMVANLRDLVDDQEKTLFDRHHQRACLLHFRLRRPQLRKTGLRWLIVEPSGVLTRLTGELSADAGTLVDLCIVQIHRKLPRNPGSTAITHISLEQLKAGAPQALHLHAADWVLLDEDLLSEAQHYLPGNLVSTRRLDQGSQALPESSALLFRQSRWVTSAPTLVSSYRERSYSRSEISSAADAEKCEQQWFERNDLAQELAWRLTRLHELRHSQNIREKDRIKRDIQKLKPKSIDISDSISEIQDIGLPSILEVIQQGIGAERSNRRSALTEGMARAGHKAFEARFSSLSWQHRMHPEISSFPRRQFYKNASLRDANTIDSRDSKLGWDFGNFPARRIWLDVKGQERSGENQDEIRTIRKVLQDFITWAKRKGAPARSEPVLWEVACLSFYVKQESALSQMLKELTGDNRKSRFRVKDAPVEIVCGTVDRFQGREADLVLLSMRNTARVGFIDSPNRLNVAITRARQQLVIVGNAEYFSGCGTAELEALAKDTKQAKPDTGKHKTGMTA